MVASVALAAGPTVVRDGNDTVGPLDIAAASLELRTKGAGADRKRFVVLRVRTYGAWGAPELARPGVMPNFLSFEFDRNRSRPADRCLDIGLRSGGALVAEMKAPCVPVGERRVGSPIRVRRVDRRRLEVVVPRRLFGRSVGRYAWRATSSFEAIGDPRCPSPMVPPPERRYGACTDMTRFARVAQ